MRRILGILLLITISLNGCKLGNGEKDEYYSYLGEYNNIDYFKGLGLHSERSINRVADDKLDALLTQDEYDLVGMISRYVILAPIDYDDRSIENHLLFNVETFEQKNIVAESHEYQQYPYNLELIKDDFLVFSSHVLNDLYVQIFNVNKNEIVAKFTINVNQSFSFGKFMIENDNLYISIHYPTKVVESKKDYVYDMEFDELIALPTRGSQYEMVVDNQLLLMLEDDFKHVSSVWVNFESGVEEVFHDMGYQMVLKFEDTIIQDAFYQDRSIKILDEELNITQTYKIDSNIDFYYWTIINDHEVMLNTSRVKGAFIQSSETKLVIYDFVIGKIVLETDWFGTGSEFK